MRSEGRRPRAALRTWARTPAFLAACLVASVGLAAFTASAAVSVSGKLTHEKEAKPGETYESVIYITNTGDEAEQVKVYQTDYLFTCDGEYSYDTPGQAPRSNTGWITFGPSRLTIPPQGSSIINYTVKVPANQNLVGTYWGIIMVEVISKTSPEVTGARDGQLRLGIDQVFRYGIQIVTHIEDTGRRRLEFLDTKLLREGDARVLEVDLENTGERWLRPALWTELYDTTGTFVGKFEAGTLRIYPGTSVRYKVDLTRVQQGNYKAVVIADCGSDDVFGATYSLSVENEETSRGK
jgi:hypothetical protein